MFSLTRCLCVYAFFPIDRVWSSAFTDRPNCSMRALTCAHALRVLGQDTFHWGPLCTPSRLVTVIESVDKSLSIRFQQIDHFPCCAAQQRVTVEPVAEDNVSVAVHIPTMGMCYFACIFGCKHHPERNLCQFSHSNSLSGRSNSLVTKLRLPSS